MLKDYEIDTRSFPPIQAYFQNIAKNQSCRRSAHGSTMLAVGTTATISTVTG